MGTPEGVKQRLLGGGQFGVGDIATAQRIQLPSDFLPNQLFLIKVDAYNFFQNLAAFLIVNSVLTIFVFVFEEMDRRKISIFTLRIDCFAYPPKDSSNPETLFDCHLKAKPCGYLPSSSRGKSFRRRERVNFYPAELEALHAA